MKAMFALAAALLLAGCAGTPTPAPAPATKGVGTIIRLDPAIDALIPKDAIIEKVGGGFQFTEGPLWRPDGHLWFSDVTGNVVRSITPDGRVQVLIEKAGGETNAPSGSFIGPNAMIADKDGFVLLCQHTNRRIVRLDKDLKQTVLLDKFQGKKFNSPNDLVYKSDGALYFTDPPYGLLKQDDDPGKELKFNGVFRYSHGKLEAVIKDLTRPNGIAFSPDEKVLYISNSDEKHKVWMRYDVNADGTVSNGRIFADVTAEAEAGLPDGMKVDSLGNIYGAGPAGFGYSRPTANISARSSLAKLPRTVHGLKTAKPCILRRLPPSTASSSRLRARNRYINKNSRTIYKDGMCAFRRDQCKEEHA